MLRIGIDVQANELITTNANDRAHLVFLDGSSLTVGPNAQLTIDKFVFDPNTKTGELAINASKGVLRLVGGKISKNNADHHHDARRARSASAAASPSSTSSRARPIRPSCSART